MHNLKLTNLDIKYDLHNSRFTSQIKSLPSAISFTLICSLITQQLREKDDLEACEVTEGNQTMNQA